MSLLEHPKAQELLDDATLSAGDVRRCRDHLTAFLKRYLPQDWAADGRRRRQCHVPDDIVFQEAWRIGLDLIDRSAQDVPCGWVAADDAFGRATQFRAQLRLRHRRYVLDIPSTTLVRE